MASERAFIVYDQAMLRYLPSDLGRGWERRQLEIGFGNGEFLVKMAEKFKDELFFGIEYQKKYFYKALKRADVCNVKNVRLFCSEAKSTLHFLFPDNFFDKIHINFPDPWPKKRHAERRLIDEDFVKEIDRILKEGGKVFVASDVEGYFNNIVSLFKKNHFVELDPSAHFPYERPFQTKYEKAFLSANKKIFYSILKKVDKQNLFF